MISDSYCVIRTLDCGYIQHNYFEMQVGHKDVGRQWLYQMSMGDPDFGPDFNFLTTEKWVYFLLTNISS